jgi:dipeptidyl aminopeptidase/acylaminoacyl peptidase
MQRAAFDVTHPIGAFYVSARYVAFSPDGRTMAAGFEMNTGNRHRAGPLVLWDVSTGRQLYKGEILALAQRAITFTVDGKYLAAKGKGVRLIEVATGKELADLDREGDGGLSGFSVSSNGKTLASLYAWGGKDPRQTVVLWNLATYQPAATFALPQPAGHVLSMAFSHDGKTLATVSEDGFIRLRALPAGTELASIQGPGCKINALCFAPDDQRLAFACDNGAVLLADVKQPTGQ